NSGATFPAVLMSTGTTALSIQFPATDRCTDASTMTTVTVSCPNTPPPASLTQPAITPAHPSLNGVQAPAGDRTSSAGSPYQATFVVTTNPQDGQNASLRIPHKHSQA